MRLLDVASKVTRRYIGNCMHAILISGSFLDDGILPSFTLCLLSMALKPSPLAPQASSMQIQIDLHISLPEASAVMDSVVLVVRWINGVDGTIDVIDRIDGIAWCLYGILMGWDELKNRVCGEKMGGKRF